MDVSKLITKTTNALVQVSSGLKKLPSKSDNAKVQGILSGSGIQAKASQGIAQIKMAMSPKQKALKEIPEELLKIFETTKGKEGEEFANAAYSGIVKYLHLEGMSPDKINIGEMENKALMGVTFGYSPFENKIMSSPEFLTAIKKPKQINGIAHELLHCKQYNHVVQTEGLGVEKLAEGFCEVNFNNWLSAVPNILRGKTNLQIIQDNYGDKASEILMQKKEELYKTILEKFKENFSTTISLNKFPLESEQGKKALEYLEAIRSYEAPGMFGVTTSGYENNVLEKEAYEFGNKIQNLYNKYIQNST